MCYSILSAAEKAGWALPMCLPKAASAYARRVLGLGGRSSKSHVWDEPVFSENGCVERPMSSCANVPVINLPNDLETQNCPFHFKEFLMAPSPAGTINKETLHSSACFPGWASVFSGRPEGERTRSGGRICPERGARAHFLRPPRPPTRSHRPRGVQTSVCRPLGKQNSSQLWLHHPTILISLFHLTLYNNNTFFQERSLIL